MSEKILNTMRGSGICIRDGAERRSEKEWRERQEANRVSHCIISRTSNLSKAARKKLYKQDHTVLWP